MTQYSAESKTGDRDIFQTGFCPFSNKAQITGVAFKEPPCLCCPLLFFPPRRGEVRHVAEIQAQSILVVCYKPTVPTARLDCTLSMMEEDTMRRMASHLPLR